MTSREEITDLEALIKCTDRSAFFYTTNAKHLKYSFLITFSTRHSLQFEQQRYFSQQIV